MLRRQSLFVSSLGILALVLCTGTAEASTRTLSYYMGGGTPQTRLGMTLVRTGRMFAFTEGEPSVATLSGSVPLDPGRESRILRYLVYDTCDRILEKEMLARCQYLLGLQRSIQTTAESRFRLSPRARTNAELGTPTRRTVDNRYRRSIDSTNRYLQFGASEGGITGRPRNFSETPTAFGEAVRLKRRLERAVAPEVEVEEGTE